MVSLVNGRFPVSRRGQAIELPDGLIKEILPEGDFHLQEERRLFYVGMTRSKEELFLTSAVDYGGKRLRRVSQFVMEALGENKQDRGKPIRTSAIEAIKRFAAVDEQKKEPPPALGEDSLINLSYYQIDDYLTCPLKYKYVNILRVPIMEHHTVIYGRAMHEAVCRYFQYKISGKDLQLGELLDMFRESFDPQGFLDERHQKERFEVGCQALTKFYNSPKTRDAKPRYIEKEFSFMYGNNKISGRFDRVDIEGDGGAVIIDFKTSEINRQEDADRRVKENSQLILYSLAYQKISGELPKRVELHFLERDLVGAAIVKESDISKILEKIDLVSGGIRKQDFNPTPSYRNCRYCAYSQICPYAELK